jgi:hypothetical protein
VTSVIAMIFIFAFSYGPQSDVRGFDDMEACQKWLSEVPAMIATHNASGDEDKIMFFAASCTPVTPASQGIGL